MNEHPDSPFLWEKNKKPSIFVNDLKFRNRHQAGTIENSDGLDYKEFGIHKRKKKRTPNKHEGGLIHTKTHNTR